MHKDGIALIKLMFNPGETICLSPNKYGYHSVPQETAISERVTMYEPERNRTSFQPSENMVLLALNPIEGQRNDSNCKAFRSFLIEMDDRPLAAQAEYIRTLGVPVSACIYSGSKSLHFLVTLDRDLASEKEYRHCAEWLLNCIPLADQKTKNPSRSIRIPGAIRPETGKEQKLVFMNGRVREEDFFNWLNQFPEARPKTEKAIVKQETPHYSSIKEWVWVALRKGLDPKRGRNQQWFAIAFEFCLSGFSESQTIEILEQYFSEDRDFKKREWLTTVKSAFKHISAKRRRD